MGMEDKVTALAKAEKGGAVEQSQPDEVAMLAIIANAAKDPEVDAEKAERMFALYERMVDRQARTAFFAALSELQAELPQINKRGKILNQDKTIRSRYALIEDVDKAIRPLLAKHGFAFSSDEGAASNDNKFFVIAGTLSHKGGYAETKRITMPFDSSQFRTSAQSRASTQSLGRRLLLKMHLNLVERGEDDDGQGGAKPITKEQVAKLRAGLVA